MNTHKYDCLIVASISISLMLPVNAWAGITIDRNAVEQASVTRSDNQVPIVNIVKPNAKGLSHNRFNRLDIHAEGLIVNNSLSVTDTRLGGRINGNPNLSGAAAGIILNEVTGLHRSQLNGLAEVAGQPAEFILANPNGISCDGCGFINTPRVTLTTGMVDIANEQLLGFDIGKGDIAIDHINASTIERLDLLARSITLNKNLHAQSLNIIAGRNMIEYADLSVTKKGDDHSAKPSFALDVAALGGMYANQIMMVGTEAGLGVNMRGEMATSTGDIHLQANGLLSVNKVVSGAGLNLHSERGNIQVTGSSYSIGETRLKAAQGNVSNSGHLIAENGLRIQAKNLYNQASANIQSFAATDIEISEDFSNLGDGISQGEITSAGSFSITANNLFNHGILGSGDSLTINALDRLENTSEYGLADAVLFSIGDLSLYGQTIINRHSQIFSLEDLTIAGNKAGVADDSAALSFQNISATLESFNDLSVTASEVLNTRDGVYRMDNSGFCPAGFLCGYGVRNARWRGMPADTRGEDFWLLPDTIAYVEWQWGYGGDWDNPDSLMLDKYQTLMDKFLPSTRESMIYAGRDFNVLAGSFRNEGSLISVGNNLTANVSGFLNMSTGAVMPDRGDWHLDRQPWVQALDYDLFYSDFLSAFIFNESFISAGNNLTINATDVISNGFEEVFPVDLVDIPDAPLPKSPSSGEAEGGISHQLLLVHQNPYDQWLDLPPGAVFDQVDVEVVLPPSSGGGLFTYTDPDSGVHRPLIATHDSVASFVDVQGSDYLLGLLGADPDTITKRLGDGFYESRLIRQAIEDTTGSRFLYDEFSSDTEQYRYLMQSAAQAQQDYDLTIGVALTREQVQNLTRDMVWLEEREVNGEAVLVPTLYLAQLRSKSVDGEGAILSARNIQLNSGGDIINVAGITAYDQVSLSARQSIRNQGGSIKAQDISIKTESGDFVHEVQGQTKAVLAAGNQLLIDSARDIHVLGSEIHVEGAAKIAAGRDLSVTSTLAEEDDSAEYFWGEKDGVTSRTVTREQRHQAEINIAGNADMATRRDMNLAGAEINIDGHASLAVGRDINLSSVTNKTTTQTRELYTTHEQQTEGGRLTPVSVSGKDSKTLERVDKLTVAIDYEQQGSEINVAGNMALQADNNVNLSASNVVVGGNSTALIGGSLELSAVDNKRVTQSTIINHYRRAPLLLLAPASSDNSPAAPSSPDANTQVRSQPINTTATATQQSYVDLSAPANTKGIKRDDNPFFSETKNSLTKLVTDTKSASLSTLGNTQIYAAGSVRNTQSSNISGADTALVAGVDIDNTGGSVIKGKNMTLVAGNDINNRRFIEQVNKNDGDFITTHVSDASRIEADGNLNMQAGRDINNRASSIHADGSGKLLAGGNINIKTVADRERRAHNKNNITDITRHMKSDVATGLDLGLLAENDINVMGSDISSGGDLRLQAKGGIQVEAETDEYYRFIHKESKGAFSKKSETTEIYQTTNVASQLRAGGELSLQSQQENIKLKGSSLQAGSDISLIAGGEVSIEAVKEIFDYRHDESESGFGGLLAKSSSVERYREKYIGVNSKSAGDTAIVSDGNIHIVASRIEAGSDIELKSRSGQIALLSHKEIDSYSSHQSDSGTVKQTLKGEGHYHETVKPTRLIAKDLVVDAKQGVVIDFNQAEGETLQQSIARLSKGDPELQWMQQLSDRDDVNWQAVQEVHDSWNYKESGISQAGAILISIAVTAATAGSGASLMQAIGMEGASKAAIASANAAINTLSTQAATSLVNNGGDIGAVLDELGSSESVKNLLVSTLSASVGLNQRGAEAYSSRDVALMAVSSVDKDLGRLLSLSLDGLTDSREAIARNFVGEAMQYAARQEVAKQAEKMGLTSEELNLILMVNSFVGREVAGTTYDKEKSSVEGFFSRKGKYFGDLSGEVGVLWDINDSFLNVQGYLDAVAQEVIADGLIEVLVGHSLGSWRVNNIARHGYVNHAVTLALPIFDFPVAGSESYCASGDAICGGSLMSVLRPDALVVDSPSSWRVLSENHRISTVPGYKLIWESFSND